MEFKSFTSLVKDEVERIAGEEYEVRVNDVLKNNGLVLSGLSMMTKDCNISPTIYLNNYYEDYESGSVSVDEVVEDVFRIYNKFRVDTKVDMDFFTDFELMKDTIIFKLVNTNRNEELLADVPHIEFHDLSIVFQCLVPDYFEGCATITIHNEHLESWEKSVEDLYEIAMENTPRLLKYDIMNIVDMMKNMTDWDEMGVEEDIFDVQPMIPMYVLTNKNKTQGAACILYKNLLKDLAQAFDCNLVILPSSIHECIIVPDKLNENLDELKEMVVSINAQEVLAEEVLSDSVYYYDREQNEIQIF